MIRRSRPRIVDFSEDHDNDSIKSYCKHCLIFGFMVQLKNRIYPDNEPIPVDHDLWKQCHECGSIVPVYEIEKESSIKDVVETTDNPFDIGKSFLGINSRSARRKMKKKKELEDKLSRIPDEYEDIKYEIRKGND